MHHTLQRNFLTWRSPQKFMSNCEDQDALIVVTLRFFEVVHLETYVPIKAYLNVKTHES